MGGNSGSASQTMEFKPPAYAAPYWEQFVKQAGNLTSQAPVQYMGQQIADLSPQHFQGMDLITQSALNGAPDVNAMRQQNMQTAQGAYLNANPYLGMDPTNRVIADTTQNMAEGFAGGQAAQNAALANMQGAFGGSGFQNKMTSDAAALSRQIGQMANQARLGQQGLQSADWQQERARQMQAAGQAPAMQNMDLQAGQALMGVGDAQSQYQQKLLDSLYQNWQLGQQAPYQNLDIMRNALAAASGGVAGGSTQSASGGGGFSPLAGLLGAAGIGYGLFGK